MVCILNYFMKLSEVVATDSNARSDPVIFRVLKGYTFKGKMLVMKRREMTVEFGER